MGEPGRNGELTGGSFAQVRVDDAIVALAVAQHDVFSIAQLKKPA
ncbi:MAG TPA: hypothetical protein VKR21_03785 [Solirubrobacteraceae bacterium]|nr:hypothetical protein [Solirubrobacteraceae bacterium]